MNMKLKWLFYAVFNINILMFCGNLDFKDFWWSEIEFEIELFCIIMNAFPVKFDHQCVFAEKKRKY